MITECLSTIRHQDGTLEPCCKQVKGQTYPLCERHFKRRFNPNNLLFKQSGSSYFCHQLIKSGKNGKWYLKYCIADKIDEQIEKNKWRDCSRITMYIITWE